MSGEPSSAPAVETRKLAAIMFTDIVGFSRQMGADEARMRRLLDVHNQVITEWFYWNPTPQTLEQAREMAQ
jgi:class 3 adenylate cyclase